MDGWRKCSIYIQWNRLSCENEGNPATCEKNEWTLGTLDLSEISQSQTNTAWFQGRDGRRQRPHPGLRLAFPVGGLLAAGGALAEQVFGGKELVESKGWEGRVVWILEFPEVMGGLNQQVVKGQPAEGGTYGNQGPGWPARGVCVCVCVYVYLLYPLFHRHIGFSPWPENCEQSCN